MDFIYMPDLVKIVEYYMNEPEPLLQLTECRYPRSYSLKSIAKIINELSEYRVTINMESTTDKHYVGTEFFLLLDYIGLEKGIKNVFPIILCFS